MLSRFLIILLFVPLSIWIFLRGDYLLLIYVEVIIAFSMYEFYKMLKGKGYEVASRIGTILGLILPIFIFFQYQSKPSFNFLGLTIRYVREFNMGSFIVFSLMLIAVRQILKVKIRGAMAEISYTLFGIIYISYFFSHILLIKYEFANGNVLVLMTFLLIWACDIAAYLVGIAIGGKIIKRRLAPEISPKKSIEGAIAGIAGVFVTIIFFDNIYLFLSNIVCSLNILGECTPYLPVNISGMAAFVLALIIGVGAEVGDLVESKIKRELKVKDSGTILLGHGGFLDRFDSALFVLPLVYYFLKYVQFV